MSAMLQRRLFVRTLAMTLLGHGLRGAQASEATVAVIGHPGLKGIDSEGLRRIYNGRTVELDGLALRPVNLPTGQELRERFLAMVMQQSDADYLAYWTVRRYVGKGTPPPELPHTAAVIAHVLRTPGAIGYVSPAELRVGINLLLQR
jgi:ABC-type phosphate transport system substrate-binding protein